MNPTDAITSHFRLTPVQLSALKRLGIRTVEQLLRHFPARYEHAGTSARARDVIAGTKVTLFGTVTGLKAKKLWKSRRNATVGTWVLGTAEHCEGCRSRAARSPYVFRAGVLQ
jgi:RecG-like helicase